MPAPRVVVAVTGSIAAYKACEVVRRLQDHGVDVRVAMSRNATEFVGALTFAALTGQRVLHSSFDDDHPERMAHVRWAERCDAFCVVPASADFIAKMAHGVADDFASTVHLAVEGSVLVAPAMEDQMWAHPAVRDNVETLRSRGVHIVEPGVGYLASGRQGPGRLAELEEIVAAILQLLGIDPLARPLAGLKVLVTAGPTREHLDPVRMLTNPSSGKMGYAVAEAARRRGAEVTLVSGPTTLALPEGIEVVRVVTAAEMESEVMGRVADQEIVVMAAAVADYRPEVAADEKLKKSDADEMTVTLVRTADILVQLGAVPGDRVIVGFAAETSELEARANEKMERKGCDLIVANLVGREGSGFEADTNEVLILDRLGHKTEVGPASKDAVADAIWEAVVAYRDCVALAAPETTG